mmetsp:Transcript_31636/g.76565  ORF Transcript_31636/g.76565 Transcript_31636/m.76565 type:complete len:256 (-) Transcript_31636:56-823(-)
MRPRRSKHQSATKPHEQHGGVVRQPVIDAHRSVHHEPVASPLWDLGSAMRKDHRVEVPDNGRGPHRCPRLLIVAPLQNKPHRVHALRIPFLQRPDEPHVIPRLRLGRQRQCHACPIHRQRAVRRIARHTGQPPSLVGHPAPLQLALLPDESKHGDTRRLRHRGPISLLQACESVVLVGRKGSLAQRNHRCVGPDKHHRHGQDEQQTMNPRHAKSVLEGKGAEERIADAPGEPCPLFAHLFKEVRGAHARPLRVER